LPEVKVAVDFEAAAVEERQMQYFDDKQEQ